MAKAMTYAQAIDIAYEIMEKYGFEPEEIEGVSEAMDRLTALQAQLAKRNGSGSAKKGLTKTQKDNIELKNHIYELLLSEPDGLTATEVGNAFNIGCQKASSMLSQMGDPDGKNKGDGRVRREQVGRVVRFFAVEK